MRKAYIKGYLTKLASSDGGYNSPIAGILASTTGPGGALSAGTLGKNKSLLSGALIGAVAGGLAGTGLGSLYSGNDPDTKRNLIKWLAIAGTLTGGVAGAGASQLSKLQALQKLLPAGKE